MRMTQPISAHIAATRTRWALRSLDRGERIARRAELRRSAHRASRVSVQPVARPALIQRWEGSPPCARWATEPDVPLPACNSGIAA